MSLFQSGPYQSKVLGSIMRQTRRWLDTGSTVLRRLKVAASWSVQILLYPIYVAFQTTRLTGSVFQQFMEIGLPTLRAQLRQATTGLDEQGPRSSRSGPLTVDTPLQQTLLTVQQLLVPRSLPMLLPPQDRDDSPAVSLTVSPQGELVVSVPETRDLERSPSQAAQALAAQAPVLVRGVASDVVTRAIVLVTNQNQSLNILTPEQQATLQRRIAWEVAHYERYCSLRQWTRRLFPEPALPGESASQPGQLVRRAVAWIRSDAVQQAGTQLWQMIASGVSRVRSLGAIVSAVQSATPALTGADTPLQQVLLTVQQFSRLGGLPLLLAQLESEGVGAPYLLATSDSTVAMAAAAAREGALESNDSSTEAPTAPRFIQGIASDLTTRSLILVTNLNQPLDILTAEQQQILRQRIIWAMACYGRAVRVRQATRQVFSRLRLPRQDSQMLPPIRAFRWLMAWMQSGPVAIAANLFQEASLALEPSEPPASELPLSTAREPRRVSSRPAIAQRILMPVGWWQRAVTLAALPFQRSSLPSELPLDNAAGGAIALTANPSSLAAVADPWAAVATIADTSIHRAPVARSPQASGSAPAALSSAERRSPDYIEIEATPIGYEQSLLERVLRWLDRILLWLEALPARIRDLWRRWRG